MSTPNQPSSIIPDAWTALRRFTGARIALGRCGHSLPTQELLNFQLAHAQARDAVHASMDVQAFAAAIGQITGEEAVCVETLARSRREYIMRPDLGRQLTQNSRSLLEGMRGTHDICLLVVDGLSATAIERNIVPFLQTLVPELRSHGFSLAPVCIVQQGRVAIGDEVGSALGSRLSVVCIGERPGLSSPDSMGIYLTYAPRPGTTDERRNCISNVRPEGLSASTAAARLLYLVRQALRLQISGVQLKDDRPAGAPVSPTGGKGERHIAATPTSLHKEQQNETASGLDQTHNRPR